MRAAVQRAVDFYEGLTPAALDHLPQLYTENARFKDPFNEVRGVSHLVLAPDGRIAEHRDYWDAAEELYEKLPLLGGLMRWLKRRANG